MSADKQIADLLGSAHEAQRRGDQATATRPFEEVLAHDSRNPAALNSLGMQALVRVDIPLHACDMVAISAHKVHGPKGIGGL